MTPADQQAILPWFEAADDLFGYRPGADAYTVPTRPDPEGRLAVRRDEWIARHPPGRDQAPLVYIGGLVAGFAEPVGPSTYQASLPYTMTIVVKVGPDHRGHRYAPAALQALVDHPGTRDIDEFRCTIWARNTASTRAASRAGFECTRTDSDGRQYFALSRAGHRTRA